MCAEESDHVFTSGYIQVDAASELSTAETGLQAQIKISPVVELYKDPVRHCQELSM